VHLVGYFHIYFSNSWDNYDVGKKVLKLNSTNIIRSNLSFSPSTPVYAESSLTAQSARSCVKSATTKMKAACLRNVGIHCRPHGVHNPEYHSVNIPYTVDLASKASKTYRDICRRISYDTSQADVFVPDGRATVQGEVRYERNVRRLEPQNNCSLPPGLV